MEFKIGRGRGECSVSGKQFEDGESYIVALKSIDDDGAYERVEICQEVWDRQGSEGFVAWWPAEHSVNRKPVLLDPDMMWEVFHRAREGKTSEEFSKQDMQAFALVAALGLMRMKKLKLTGTKRKGEDEIMIFATRGRRKKETFELVNPGMDEDAIDKVQERLADLA